MNVGLGPVLERLRGEWQEEQLPFPLDGRP
jgi:hypothetical protein